MKLLQDILYRVAIESVVGSTHRKISEICFDSRKVTKEAVFVAILGTQVDGHQFIDNAINKGAMVVVCQNLPTKTKEDITFVQVSDSLLALSVMAANYFDHPSSSIQLIGVTGTNGKTTIATLLYHLFQQLGYSVGLISTIHNAINEKVIVSTHTTPDAIQLNALLKRMVDAGVTFCFMEVSSHGIAQKRIAALNFEGGIFTNLSHDHLDYHRSFEDYRDTKKIFFDRLSPSAFALTNADDKNGSFMLQNSVASTYRYGIQTAADFNLKILESRFDGMLLKINQQDLWTQLVGNFNASNVLAVYATAKLLDVETSELLNAISTLEPVSGRFELVAQHEGISAIIDYAHTPDALKKVLETINQIRTGNESLITVVGCGGNRDKAKRPIIGQIATLLSDKVIFTSDNPRDEHPDNIISEIEKGVDPIHFKKYSIIQDRRQAIKIACQMAQPNDIILVAGKGHENYQEINGNRFDFNDANELKQNLEPFV